ncbi:hypothetical protein D3C87_1566910 [compost metagenome]
MPRLVDHLQVPGLILPPEIVKECALAALLHLLCVPHLREPPVFEDGQRLSALLHPVQRVFRGIGEALGRSLGIDIASIDAINLVNHIPDRFGVLAKTRHR